MEYIEHKEDKIEVYFKGKKIFAVEAYDFHNRKVVDTKYQWLGGVFEEVQPYIVALVNTLANNLSNTFLDEKRKEAFEMEQLLKQIKKEIWNE